MDYRQQTGAANTWRRACQVTIDNSRERTPSIFFQEEDVVAIDGREYRTSVMVAGAVRGVFDPTATVDLINPETGEPLGATATHGQLYVILHSLYLQLAAERDAAVLAPMQPPSAPPPAPEPAPPAPAPAPAPAPEPPPAPAPAPEPPLEP